MYHDALKVRHQRLWSWRDPVALVLVLMGVAADLILTKLPEFD